MEGLSGRASAEAEKVLACAPFAWPSEPDGTDGMMALVTFVARLKK
jgi:hypothetical protein